MIVTAHRDAMRQCDADENSRERAPLSRRGNGELLRLPFVCKSGLMG
jgi:hypothetical protein